jgi:hypothetical protein
MSKMSRSMLESMDRFILDAISNGSSNGHSNSDTRSNGHNGQGAGRASTHWATAGHYN